MKPRGELEGVETGLGDISIVVTAFHADKVPLYEVSYKTPFTTNNLDLIARTTKKMEGMFPAYAAGWKKFNQMSLYPTGAVDNYIIISKSPIKSLTDLKGRKVGAAGPNLPWVLAAGAAGVQTNLADAYNSLSTGIYDNMVVWQQAMGAFKLCEPVERHGKNYRRGTTVFERTARAGSQSGSEHPADSCAADKTEKRNAFIGDQFFGSVVVSSDDCLAPTIGQARFAENLNKTQA